MFLTLEDPNAKTQGSRDPLGTQPMWQKFGRHVVTNLTMQTNSVRGFTILLLGRYLTERLIEEGRLGRKSAVDAFLRFEQLGAYVRHAAHGVGGGGIRGIERVRSNLQKHGGRVRVGAHPDQCILLDQRVAGLWGLFSVSARVSGLLPDDPVGLKPEAKAFVERTCLRRLQPIMEPLLRLVERGGVLDTRTPDAGLRCPERAPAGIVHGGGAAVLRRVRSRRRTRGGKRRRPAGSERSGNCSSVAPNSTSARGARTLCGCARRRDPSTASSRKTSTESSGLEAVIAPAMALLDFMLVCHRRTLDDAARELAERWSASVPNIHPDRNRDLLPEIGCVAPETIPECLDRCQQALAGGDYQEALKALLAWHQHVMRARARGAVGAGRGGSAAGGALSGRGTLVAVRRGASGSVVERLLPVPPEGHHPAAR